MPVNVLFSCISVLSKSRSLKKKSYFCNSFLVARLGGSLLYCCFFAGECCLRGKMLLAPRVPLLQKQCGALFAELWVMPSFAEHPCPGLPTFTSLNVLEPKRQYSQQFREYRQAVSTWVWQVGCVVTVLLLQHFWSCVVNSHSSDSSENSIFMLIFISSLFYRTSPLLLIFSSYHLLWPISIIAFLECSFVSLNRYLRANEVLPKLPENACLFLPFQVWFAVTQAQAQDWSYSKYFENDHIHEPATGLQTSKKRTDGHWCGRFCYKLSCRKWVFRHLRPRGWMLPIWERSTFPEYWAIFKKSCRGFCERKTETQNTRKIILVTFLIFWSLSVNLRVKARSEKSDTLSPQTTKYWGWDLQPTGRVGLVILLK